MIRFSTSIALIAVLGACATDVRGPAGGYGPFDPPPPAPFVPPEAISTLPPVDGQQPLNPAVAGAQTPGAPAEADPNAALARDVTAALGATGAPSGDTTQTTQVGETVLPGSMGIDPNADSINLNLSSQEQQIRERTVAQQRREAAQQQLVIVEPEPVPQQDTNANVVQFARETTHPVGTKRYNRPAFRDRIQSASVCRRFDNDDEAQRQFLANGGPSTDRFNLDPDGDGFACQFDPEKYRKLNF